MLSLLDPISESANRPTAEYIRLILKYDPEMGSFIWKRSKRSRAISGKHAGTARNGYIIIGIDKKYYRAHHLAWLYMTGEWPPSGMQMDHIDRNRSNNKWNNLRLATASNNRANSVKTRESYWGQGVRRYGTRRGCYYIARLNVMYEEIHLGKFKTAEEARTAYNEARQKYFGQYDPIQERT